MHLYALCRKKKEGGEFLLVKIKEDPDEGCLARVGSVFYKVGSCFFSRRTDPVLFFLEGRNRIHVKPHGSATMATTTTRII